MYVRLIIFMDDVFIMVASKEEITLARDSLIYLLQALGFFDPSKIKFLGVEIDSVEMTLKLLKAKKDQILNHCQTLFEKL